MKMQESGGPGGRRKQSRELMEAGSELSKAEAWVGE